MQAATLSIRFSSVVPPSGSVEFQKVRHPGGNITRCTGTYVPSGRHADLPCPSLLRTCLDVSCLGIFSITRPSVQYRAISSKAVKAQRVSNQWLGGLVISHRLCRRCRRCRPVIRLLVGSFGSKINVDCGLWGDILSRTSGGGQLSVS